jgi:hypothetical protein
MFFSPKRPNRIYGPHNLLISKHLRDLSPDAKQWEIKPGCPLPSIEEFKKVLG